MNNLLCIHALMFFSDSKESLTAYPLVPDMKKKKVMKQITELMVRYTAKHLIQAEF